MFENAEPIGVRFIQNAVSFLYLTDETPDSFIHLYELVQQRIGENFKDYNDQKDIAVLCHKTNFY